MHKQMQIPMYLGVGTNLKRKEVDEENGTKAEEKWRENFFVYFAESWKPGTNPTQKGR